VTITNAAAVSAGSGQGWPQVGALLLAFGFLGGGSAAANPPGYQRRRSCVLRVLIVRKLSTVTRELTGPHATDPGAIRGVLRVVHVEQRRKDDD